MKTDILYCYKYSDEGEGEIALMDFETRTAYEFTASDTHKDKHLRKLDDSWNKVFISGNSNPVLKGLPNEFYPDFILRMVREYPIISVNKIRW